MAQRKRLSYLMDQPPVLTGEDDDVTLTIGMVAFAVLIAVGLVAVVWAIVVVLA